MKTIYTEEIILKDETRIKLLFSFDREIINKIRRLPDCRWNQDLLFWHIHYIENHLDYLNKMFAGSFVFKLHQITSSASIPVDKEYKANPNVSGNISIVDIEVHTDYNYFLVNFNKPLDRYGLKR